MGGVRSGVVVVVAVHMTFSHRIHPFAVRHAGILNLDTMSRSTGVDQPSLSRSLRYRMSSASVDSIWSCIWPTSSFSRIPT